jgi:hypothetical protein
LALAKCCVVKDKYSGTTRLVEGLALVDLCLKTHYKPSDDALLKKLSRKRKLFAIPQSSALVSDDGALSVLGDVFVFEAGEKRRFHE